MKINQYLDSTYLKTAALAGISEKENTAIVQSYVQEAIEESFKLIMIRPEHVKMAHELIVASNSKVLVGTVIDFPNGNSTLEAKLLEAKETIANQADELDFVLNYEAFKNGETALVKQEIIACTSVALHHKKAVKFIIEVAALSHKEIIQLCVLIKNAIFANFREENFSQIFVKSSTGFYQTENNLPNGATRETIILMLENASPLPIKAAGGVRNIEEAESMIHLGVKRIGTSAAKNIVNGSESKDY